MKKLLFLFFALLLPLCAEPIPYLSQITSTITHRFQEHYPQMQIERLEVKLLSPLPKKSPLYYRRTILTDASLKRAKGSFTLILSTGTRERRLYGSYHLYATLPQLLAASDLPSGSLLTAANTHLVRRPFTFLYHEPIPASSLGKIRLRHFVKAQKPLSRSDITQDFAINRNDTITAILQEGALKLTFRAKALQNGAIGDVIKIKKGYNRLLKARVLSRGRVEVVE